MQDDGTGAGTAPPLPDPDRLGGPGWLRRTGGRLTSADRRRMLAVACGTQLELLGQRLRRRRGVAIDLTTLTDLPDTALVREAEEAAAEHQSAELLAHGYRTAVFARALARIDRVAVDDELLVVCGLLHDAGLEPSVPGEDFTIRSAACATGAATRVGRADACAHLEDAITVHTTIGVRVERDGALGAYTQFGAMVDLVGLRERHLPHALVASTVAKHPRAGFVGCILPALGREARAVPGGRFAFLRGVGFSPAVRIASVPSRP